MQRAREGIGGLPLPFIFIFSGGGKSGASGADMTKTALRKERRASGSRCCHQQNPLDRSSSQLQTQSIHKR
jgi:hypothetical protein